MRTDQQWIGADIRSLERHKRTLETLRDELTSPIVIMGPGSDGRNALGRSAVHAYGMLLVIYNEAITALSAQYDALEPDDAETV